MQISTKSFTSELSWIKRFVEGKTTIPILSNVALVAQAGSLALMGTDLEVGGISRIEVDSKDDWSITVPAKDLLNYLRKVSDETVTLTPIIERRKVTEKCKSCEDQPKPECPICKGKGETTKQKVTRCELTLKHGEDSAVTIMGMDAESFPVMPLAPITTYLAGLDTAVPRALVSISTEESRFTLNGALLYYKDGAGKLISTDGHRLGLVDIQVASDQPEIRTIICHRAIEEIGKLNGGQVFMGMDEHHHIFTDGKRTVVARKLTGNFPDWERVAPKSSAHHLTFDSAAMDKVLDRVLVFADERSHAIRLNVHAGKLTASTEAIERGAAKGAVPAEGVNGTNLTIGFSGQYMRDFFKHAPGTVTLDLNDEKSAGVLATEGFKYILMPMRL